MSEEIEEVEVSKVEGTPTVINNEVITVDDIVDQIESGLVTADISRSSEDSQDNMKLYIIKYAESRLRNVLKMTDRLDILTDQLFDMADDSYDPELVLKTINTMQSTLDSSIKLIQQVTTDESYMHFILNDNRQVINNFTNVDSDNEALSLNKDSRDKLRSVVGKMLVGLDKEKDNS